MTPVLANKAEKWRAGERGSEAGVLANEQITHVLANAAPIAARVRATAGRAVQNTPAHTPAAPCHVSLLQLAMLSVLAKPCVKLDHKNTFPAAPRAHAHAAV